MLSNGPNSTLLTQSAGSIPCKACCNGLNLGLGRDATTRFHRWHCWIGSSMAAQQPRRIISAYGGKADLIPEPPFSLLRPEGDIAT